MTTSCIIELELLPTPVRWESDPSDSHVPAVQPYFWSSAKQVSISLASTVLGDGCLMWRVSKQQLDLQGPSACKVTSFSCAKRRAISSRSCFLTRSWLCWPRLPFTTCSQLWIHAMAMHGPKFLNKQTISNNIGNIDSNVWPIWSTEIRWGSVGLLPARIASSLAYQPVDTSDTSTEGVSLALPIYDTVMNCWRTDRKPWAFAACFSRTLIRTHILMLCALSENCWHKLPKLDITRCDASDKNLISSQAWSLRIINHVTSCS